MQIVILVAILPGKLQNHYFLSILISVSKIHSLYDCSHLKASSVNTENTIVNLLIHKICDDDVVSMFNC